MHVVVQQSGFQEKGHHAVAFGAAIGAEGVMFVEAGGKRRVGRAARPVAGQFAGFEGKRGREGAQRE